MKILVTGTNGQVGFQLKKQLSQRDDINLRALDRNGLDISDAAAVDQAVDGFQPDVIINAAAYTAVDKAETDVDAAYRVNCEGPKNLAVAAQRNAAALLHISTDYVFSGNKDSVYRETDPVDPQGIYGKSKLAGERAVSDACERHIILRTAWVFGEDGNNFVKTMLRLGAERDELGIVADQFGGPTYAVDIAAALIKIAEKVCAEDFDQYGVYHYSGLPHVSWFDFADYIFDRAVEKQLISRKPSLNRLTTTEYPTPARRPANSRLATDKIAQAFDVVPSDWKRALGNIEHYLSRG
jgi:dTDP-4-dehydrorhamnose reductase